jgi:hypothetical protein
VQKHCFGGFQPKLIAYLQWISTRISFFQIKVHVHEKEGKEEKRAKCLKFFGSTLKPRWRCSFGKVLKPISITSSIMRFISLPIYWIVSLLSKLIYENLFSKKTNEKGSNFSTHTWHTLQWHATFEIPSYTKEPTL